MSLTTACAGLASGLLLTAAAVTLWDGFRPTRAGASATRVVGWIAAVLLLAGALLAELGVGGVPAPVGALLLIASVAAVPGAQYRRPSPWSEAARGLPALMLAGAVLLWPVSEGSANVGRPLIAPVALADVIVVLVFRAVAGLGARAVGQALSDLAAATSGSRLDQRVPPVWMPSAVYISLTLLGTALVLVSLSQRGTLWSRTAAARGLAAAWLAWTAAWLSAGTRPRLHAVVSTLAGVLLVLVVVTVPYEL